MHPAEHHGGSAPRRATTRSDGGLLAEPAPVSGAPGTGAGLRRVPPPGWEAHGPDSSPGGPLRGLRVARLRCGRNACLKRRPFGAARQGPPAAGNLVRFTSPAEFPGRRSVAAGRLSALIRTADAQTASCYWPSGHRAARFRDPTAARHRPGWLDVPGSGRIRTTLRPRCSPASGATGNARGSRDLSLHVGRARPGPTLPRTSATAAPWCSGGPYGPTSPMPPCRGAVRPDPPCQHGVGPHGPAPLL